VGKDEGFVDLLKLELQMHIERKIKLAGSKGEKEVLALFDSGATYSLLPPKVARELAVLEPLPESLRFRTAEVGREVTAKERVVLNLYIDNFRFTDEFMVVEDLSEEAIIGVKTLQAWRIKLDFEHDEIICDPRTQKLRLIPLRTKNDRNPKFKTKQVYEREVG
jgi:predicted aspartyl protease